jgi:hypothetical protein
MKRSLQQSRVALTRAMMTRHANAVPASKTACGTSSSSYRTRWLTHNPYGRCNASKPGLDSTPDQVGATAPDVDTVGIGQGLRRCPDNFSETLTTGLRKRRSAQRPIMCRQLLPGPGGDQRGPAGRPPEQRRCARGDSGSLKHRAPCSSPGRSPSPCAEPCSAVVAAVGVTSHGEGHQGSRGRTWPDGSAGAEMSHESFAQELAVVARS